MAFLGGMPAKKKNKLAASPGGEGPAMMPVHKAPGFTVSDVGQPITGTPATGTARTARYVHDVRDLAPNCVLFRPSNDQVLGKFPPHAVIRTHRRSVTSRVQEREIIPFPDSRK